MITPRLSLQKLQYNCLYKLYQLLGNQTLRKNSGGRFSCAWGCACHASKMSMIGIYWMLGACVGASAVVELTCGRHRLVDACFKMLVSEFATKTKQISRLRAIPARGNAKLKVLSCLKNFWDYFLSSWVCRVMNSSSSPFPVASLYTHLRAQGSEIE